MSEINTFLIFPYSRCNKCEILLRNKENIIYPCYYGGIIFTSYGFSFSLTCKECHEKEPNDCHQKLSVGKL